MSSESQIYLETEHVSVEQRGKKRAEYEDSMSASNVSVSLFSLARFCTVSQ